ncbi:Pentatricopeptide repeat-containing protein [Nymphaea thermarum]|nr:Pentatricopeptide repeat-containing protein [Nymphaea thermarum]
MPLLEMASKRGMNLTSRDEATKIDLLNKIKGIVVGENLRGENGGAEFCFLVPLAFNNLMTLCSKDGKPEKVPAIISDLMAKKVMLDVFSYNVWMRSPAAASNIIGVEKAPGEKGNDRVTADSTTFSIITPIYVNAGLKEKADKALE